MTIDQSTHPIGETGDTDELVEIDALLMAGQGDDDGPQIMPDFESGMSVSAKVEACLHLLETRRDVISGYESSLAAEKLRVAELERELQILTDTHDAHMEILQRCANARHALEQRVAALVGALARLIQTATLLHQNAVGCATNHHGNDIELHGLPGWLADAEKDIVSAAALGSGA